jgi:hypothetical protein
MLDALISAVHDYLDRQGDFFLKGVFDEFSERSSSSTETLIRADRLHDALLKLDIHVSREKEEELMAIMDLDVNGGLDYDEFKRAVAQPPTQLEQWASMLPLAGLLARSLPIRGGQGDQPLRDFSRLRVDEIDTAVDAFRVGLRRLLLEAKTTTKQMFDNVDKKASEAAKDSAGGISAVSKFKSFKMSTGKIADYYEGLISRIGK